MIIQCHKRKAPRERTKALVDQFVESMKTNLRFFADGKLSDQEIGYLAEYTVNRLDFNDKWQMHKGLGYYARHAVERYLGEKEKDQGEKNGK